MPAASPAGSPRRHAAEPGWTNATDAWSPYAATGEWQQQQTPSPRTSRPAASAAAGGDPWTMAQWPEPQQVVDSDAVFYSSRQNSRQQAASDSDGEWADAAMHLHSNSHTSQGSAMLGTKERPIAIHSSGSGAGDWTSRQAVSDSFDQRITRIVKPMETRQSGNVGRVSRLGRNSSTRLSQSHSHGSHGDVNNSGSGNLNQQHSHGMHASSEDSNRSGRRKMGGLLRFFGGGKSDDVCDKTQFLKP